jgi:hypothetical protein
MAFLLNCGPKTPWMQAIRRRFRLKTVCRRQWIGLVHQLVHRYRLLRCVHARRRSVMVVPTATVGAAQGNFRGTRRAVCLAYRKLPIRGDIARQSRTATPHRDALNILRVADDPTGAGIHQFSG